MPDTPLLFFYVMSTSIEIKLAGLLMLGDCEFCADNR